LFLHAAAFFQETRFMKRSFCVEMLLCLFVVAVFFSVVGMAGSAWSQEKPAKKGKENPAFAPVKDDPALPRVLLIGDSISIGYTVPVQKALAGKANVHRIPENGGPTTNGLEKIDRWLGDGKWDVIHFNWGLHDLKIAKDEQRNVPIDQYEKNLRTLVERLKKTGATLVWCSTTPVPAKVRSPIRKTDDVAAYNAVAKKVMEENGIAIDDLYSFALPQLKEIQLPENVHYTEKGYEVLAGQVVASITKALESRKSAK
jgi:acyl-CoA thioesterase-1